MKNRNSLLRFILLAVGIILLVNILSDSFFFRLDFTADKRYTLSDATTNILKNIKQPVTVKAYFSENLPPDVAKTKRDFKDLLVEYGNRSKGKVVYTFINPNEKEEIEKQATESGIQPVMINVREKDQIKQQKAYLGAVVSMGERTEVIPFMQPGAAMEYSLSSALKKLSMTDKQVVGIVQGHGEPSLRAMQQAINGLSVLYEVEEVTLNDSQPVPDRYKTLAIINPTDSFSFGQLQRLNEFLSQGKKLFVAYNRVTADLSKASGSSRHTGLEDWLSQKNIQIEDKFIVDATCGTINVLQQQGAFQFNSQIQFPYFPLINKFEEHPVTKGLEQVLLRFPTPLKYSGGSDIKFTPIIKTSAQAGVIPSPTFFNIQKQWTVADFPNPNVIIGGALSGRIAGEANTKMVVIANGDFAVNGEGQGAMQLPPDNINLFVNSIDWLSDESGLIELRTKGVTSRPLGTIEDGTKIFYKYLNFLLPIIIIVLYGFIRFQYKRAQRVKRMEESYT